MEESVPNTTPSIMAKANERTLSPPRKKMQSSTRRVVMEVINVRVNVLLSDSLNRRSVARLG